MFDGALNKALQYLHTITHLDKAQITKSVALMLFLVTFSMNDVH